MLMTVLEGRVAEDRVGGLECAFEQAGEALPLQIVSSSLVRDTDDPERFQIVTVWKSRDALEAYRATVEKPEGVQMFEDAGVSPELSILEVMVHARHEA
jgi:hypothetical protein